VGLDRVRDPRVRGGRVRDRLVHPEAQGRQEAARGGRGALDDVGIEELTPAEIDSFLREQFVARIGCHTDGETYVVPVIYAWDGECAWVQSIEGRKTRMLRANPEVCFEVDEYRDGSWRSVILWGRYEELAGADAERAIELLVERLGRRRRARGGVGQVDAPTPVAFRIRCERATGRRVVRGAGSGSAAAAEPG
jgi:nitroimidazol reductase NimA-like FMN-containing flavoprotein (pyridoxamine 5'-phosphate oxidase superfamily)